MIARLTGDVHYARSYSGLGRVVRLFGRFVLCSTAGTESGVKPSVISLPAGPGSIEGLGRSFQPRLNSGSFSYSIPIRLPSGPAAFSPAVELVYDSGFGNSAVGQGWQLSGPFEIDRLTEKRFPALSRFRCPESW